LHNIEIELGQNGAEGATGGSLMTRKLSRILMVMLSLVSGLALLCSTALADTLTLTGTPTGYTMGGEYTDPYQFTVNGASTILLSCDDFNTNVYIGETWNATKLNLSDAGTEGKFATEADSQTKYDEAGWLIQQLMGMLSDASITGLDRSNRAGWYSFAVWEIFAPSDKSSQDPSTKLDATDQGKVAGYINDASLAVKAGADLSNVYVYRPDPLSAAQEYIGVPEASTLAFLAFNFLALPGLLLFLRRRFLRT
jgi:hypothetical protein